MHDERIKIVKNTCGAKGPGEVVRQLVLEKNIQLEYC